jgi:hypothetical protein
MGPAMPCPFCLKNNQSFSWHHEKGINKLIYIPPDSNEKEPEKITLGVKFSQNIYVSPSVLDKWNIKYDDSDLEDGPCGKCAVIKRLEENYMKMQLFFESMDDYFNCLLLHKRKPIFNKERDIVYVCEECQKKGEDNRKPSDNPTNAV